MAKTEVLTVTIVLLTNTIALIPRAPVVPVRVFDPFTSDDPFDSQLDPAQQLTAAYLLPLTKFGTVTYPRSRLLSHPSGFETKKSNGA